MLPQTLLFNHRGRQSEELRRAFHDVGQGSPTTALHADALQPRPVTSDRHLDAHDCGAGPQTGGKRKQRGGSVLSLLMAAVRCSGQQAEEREQMFTYFEHFVHLLFTPLVETTTESQSRP